MLKFRFRKKEMRRRSNSCPNLESCTSSFDPGICDERANTDVNKHSSCFLEEKSDQESDTEVLSPTRKERLHAQKSIKKVKKKEKEHQVNVEKNLLSADDFWRKLDSLKEWLHDEGSKEVEGMQSPKLRSHFKKFIKLWNKRKLPLKYYKNCCVDAEAESSSTENPVNSQSPSTQSQTPNAFTFDFLPHATLKDLPSYHHFPFLDESSDQLSSLAQSSVFISPSLSCKDVAMTNDCKDNGNNDSQFATFGKSMFDTLSSTSRMAKQIDVRSSKRKGSKSKGQTGPNSPSSVTSPKKFASIFRSTPASSVFKSSSPQIHAVGSPTCPYPTPIDFTHASTEKTGSVSNDRSAKNPSPAYMCVQDAIPFDRSSPSPKYWQVGFDDDVFDGEHLDSHYCSLSPFFKGKKTSILSKATNCSSNPSRSPSNLSRRRSKSMEDIYAVPSRLLMTMGQKVTSPLHEEIRLTIPPVPVKRFTPTSSLVSLSSVLRGKQNPPSCSVLSTSSDTLISSSETVNSCDKQIVSVSDFTSVNSLSTDMGYHSGKFEDSSVSQRNISTVFLSNIKSSSSFKNHQSIAGVKRRSEEYETNIDEIDSPKKNRSNSSDLNSYGANDVRNLIYNDGDEISVNDTVDTSIADFLKDPPTLKVDTNLQDKVPSSPQEIPKKSILTGSLNPTTRTPKINGNSGSKKMSESGRDRLSILQIQVLDKSPTFPRRRIKRRSSSLAVTPGKGLTFGNKSNPRLAVSSPRRVSFAKNVKNSNDTTPTKRRSSSSSFKVSSSAGDVKKDISRQSHNKAEFDSFWARHENKPNNPNSPVKEVGNGTKRWSPSKWLSSSKETTFSGDNSSVHSHSSIGSSNINENNGDGKMSFIRSLSPKKIFSSLQKNSSPSSLLSAPNNSSTISTFTSPSNLFESPCMKESREASLSPTKPKSILKNNTHSSPITVPRFTGQMSRPSTSPQKQYTENVQSKKMNDLHRGLSSRKSNELNLNHCQSPPRLGVASLKAAHFATTQNISSLPRSKQRMLFKAQMSQDKSLIAEQGKQLNTSLEANLHGVLTKEKCPPRYIIPEGNREKQNLNPKEVIDEQVYPEHNVTSQEYRFDFNHKTMTDNLSEISHKPHFLSEEINEDNGRSDDPTPCFDLKSSKSFSDYEKPLEGMMNTTHDSIFSDTKDKCTDKEQELNCVAGNFNTLTYNEGHHNTLSSLGMQLASWNNDSGNFTSATQRTLTSRSLFSKKTEIQNTDESNDEIVAISRTDTESLTVDPHQQLESPKTYNEYPYNATDDSSHDDSHSNTDSLNITFEGRDKQLSKSVLERIKSFRSSPKVEENDGWITERRSSRGNKSRSFRNSPNKSLLQSPVQLQENSEIAKLHVENIDKIMDHPLGNIQENMSNENYLDTNEVHHSYLEVNKESSHQHEDKMENITIPNICHFHTAVTDDNIMFSSDVDKGYETESRSGKDDKIHTKRGQGNFEDVSTSSLTSSDSGNCGKFDTISSDSSCPIYDVPKTGIHVVKPVNSSHNYFSGNSQPNVASHDSKQGINSNGNSVDPPQPNQAVYEKNNSLQRDIISRDTTLSLSAQSSSTSNKDHKENKENNEFPVKPSRPKPLVKPKPKPSLKPGMAVHQSNTTCLSPKVKSSTSLVQPTVKRRSSLIKRESVSVRNTPRPSISSSFKSNNNCINSNQSNRPIVRKRSSVANREESLKGKSFKNLSTVNTSNKIVPQNTDTKRESITQSNRRKRTSLEKGSRRSSTGVSSGPEQSSFAQRRKFFQQLQASANNSSSSVVKRPQTASVKISNSLLVKAQHKPVPKPVVSQNPGAT